MTNSERQTNRGCLNRLTRQISLTTIGILMIVVSILNLSFSSVLTETCGIVHPVLFEVSVEVIELNEDNLNIPFSNSALPVEPMPDAIDESLIAVNWESCLQYYGYTDSGGNFQTNYLGQEVFFRSVFTLDGEDFDFRVEPRTSDTPTPSITWVIYDFDANDDTETPVRVDAKVILSAWGMLILYLVLPGLVIILPLLSVLMLRIARDTIWWLIMIVLIASQSLTASLFYIQLSSVSGINTLEDFGTGIFTGIITGMALAFMSKVLDNFSVADF